MVFPEVVPGSKIKAWRAKKESIQQNKRLDLTRRQQKKKKKIIYNIVIFQGVQIYL